MYSKGFHRFSLLFTLLFYLDSSAQLVPNRVDPPHWFVGMEYDTLELLVSGTDWTETTFGLSEGEKVFLANVEIASNAKYAYLSLIINSEAPAQIIEFFAQKGRKKKTFSYELRERTASPAGLTPSDIMYLITPDRFANGDPSNDVMKGFNNTELDRTDGHVRHGGDLQGILDHLDYIEDLGINALWLNPVLEANEFKEPYHGYAITDHYAIDPHYGDLDVYGSLLNEMKKREMKMVMDVVYNHFGSQHYLVLDPPENDWIHQFDDYTKTNFRASVLLDPHAAPSEKKLFNEGWFDTHMPDMNYDNAHLARYMIQNTLWWIETYGLDALRIDTYAYPEQEFMAELSNRVRREFPGFFLFGETWVHGHQVQSWFPEEMKQRKGAGSGQTSVTDFQWCFAINKGVNEKYDWSEGISRIYYTLAADWLYAHPDSLVTFVDNHDLARFFGVVNGDMNKFKWGVGNMLTTRGIPCVYYGTEILMKETESHGVIREDFPGGWPGDSVNKFLPSGRSEAENEAFNFIRDLNNLRRNHSALAGGRLTQYTPDQGEYVYFRHNEYETFMIVMNGNDEPHTFKLDRYSDFLTDESILTNALDSTETRGNEPFELPARGFKIYRVQN